MTAAAEFFHYELNIYLPETACGNAHFFTERINYERRIHRIDIQKLVGSL